MRVVEFVPVGDALASFERILALKIADWIAVMNSGKIVEMGNAHEVMLTPNDEYTMKLVGSRIGLCCHDHHTETA